MLFEHQTTHLDLSLVFLNLANHLFNFTVPKKKTLASILTKVFFVAKFRLA